MSLLINAPGVEGRLQKEAAKRGLTAADFAARILAYHLGPEQTYSESAAPFYVTATHAQWENAFDKWINGHPSQKPLPDTAVSREGIYEGRV